MNYILADHIISPLASGTRANFEAVIKSDTALKLHQWNDCPVEPFVASMFDWENIELIDGCSRFETLSIRAINGAIGDEWKQLAYDEDTIFVLSTTKGNIEYLSSDGNPLLHSSAKKIAAYFGNHNSPIVVCNACISGVCALITAQRLLENGKYKHAVVVGCDVLSPFIVSGFQSFKALSDEQCRPFDSCRKGLNLGEAAACVILTADKQLAQYSKGSILAGSIHNDANHISGPSRTAQGSYLCLKDVIDNIENIAFVNLHGTATMYNDEMESIAITRADLTHVPVNTLKSIYGHCLGAAGLLETILSLYALKQGVVLPIKNYSEQGTTYQLNISNSIRETNKTEFIKLISGFGGCNAAIRVGLISNKENQTHYSTPNLQTIAQVKLTTNAASVDGNQLPTTEHGEKILTELYRTYVKDYPKFFKMDTLSRLGFVATELLLQKSRQQTEEETIRAIVFANSSASLKNDKDYQQTILHKDNYYPSPALFVYTLPNIVTGEVAIRNLYRGETSFYVLGNDEQLQCLAELAFCQDDVDSVIVGWVECSDKDDFNANIKLIKRI